MRDPHEVIIRPVVTEKTTAQMEDGPVYTFIVDPGANKVEIGRAVEAIFDVVVVNVRTMRYPGKPRRSIMARLARNFAKGRRASFKKAVIRLAEGDSIELYEAG